MTSLTALLDEMSKALDAYEDEVGDRGMPYSTGWNRIGDAHLALEERAELLAEALRPFAQFGTSFTDTDGRWRSVPGEQLQRIYVWFGPSDFRAASNALGNPTFEDEDET